MCRLSRSRLACEDAAEPAVCGVAGVAGTVAAAPSVSLRSFGGGDRISKSGNSRRSYNKVTQHNPIPVLLHLPSRIAWQNLHTAD